MRVRAVDFRRPSKFTRDQIRQFERAHEVFCRSLSTRLSAELRTEFETELVGHDQLPYSVVMMETVPRDGFVVLLGLEPHGTQIGLIMELKLAQGIITRLLGGDIAATAAEERLALTELEIAVSRCALASIADTLSGTWADLAGVRLKISSTETSPIGVEIAPASEPTLLLALACRLEGFESSMTICLPHRSVAAMLRKLDRDTSLLAEADAGAADLIHGAVSGVSVELRAEVGGVELPVSDILGLGPGSIVPLRRPAARGVVVHVDGVPVYEATPGRNGNVRAVQIRRGLFDG
jgi:flagellar motor switch protein FliM